VNLKQLACIVFVALAASCVAAPTVAYVGNVSVHSASTNAKIMVVDQADGSAVNVSEGLASARSPAWSPDGKRLAFEAIEKGLLDVFACNPDGSERANVTASPDTWDGSPCFVGSDSIAYLSGPDKSHIWVTHLPTGEKRRLTQTPLFFKPPVSSPDGRVLAAVGSDKLAGPGRILVIDVQTGASRILTASAALYSRPAFSPDSTALAFCFDGVPIEDATRGVALAPVNGGPAKLLARDGYPLAPLCFSPNGKQIAYTSSSCYHSTWVRVMNGDGSDNQKITPSSAHIIGWPCFTADGKGLVYQGVYGARYTVRLIDLQTGANTQITPDGQTGVTPACSPR